jgi:hypothetical protein
VFLKADEVVLRDDEEKLKRQKSYYSYCVEVNLKKLIEG